MNRIVAARLAAVPDGDATPKNQREKETTITKDKRRSRGTSVVADAMLRLRAQGLFQRVLFIDTWHLTSLHGAPISWDGNHRTTTFQTLVWTLLRFAFLQLRRAHS